MFVIELRRESFVFIVYTRVYVRRLRFIRTDCIVSYNHFQRVDVAELITTHSYVYCVAYISN